MTSGKSLFSGVIGGIAFTTLTYLKPATPSDIPTAPPAMSGEAV